MRSGIRGLLAGSLALVALHTLVATPAAGRVGALLQVPGRIAVRFLDPTVAAIPDLAGRGAGGTPQGSDVGAPGGGGKSGAGGGGGGSWLTQGAGTAGQARYPDPFRPPNVGGE